MAQYYIRLDEYNQFDQRGRYWWDYSGVAGEIFIESELTPQEIVQKISDMTLEDERPEWIPLDFNWGIPYVHDKNGDMTDKVSEGFRSNWNFAHIPYTTQYEWVDESYQSKYVLTVSEIKGFRKI